MRNIFTDQEGSMLTMAYHLSGLSVDNFINMVAATTTGIFDVTYLHKTTPIESLTLGDQAASFHAVHNGRVVTYYYWQSRDKWFCKM